MNGIFDSTIGELYAIKKYKNFLKEDQLKNYIKGKLAVELEKDIPDDKLVSLPHLKTAYLTRF